MDKEKRLRNIIKLVKEANTPDKRSFEEAELEAEIRKVIFNHYLIDDTVKGIAKLFKSLLRSELIAYENWVKEISSNLDGEQIIATTDELVDEYLKQKK
jgi:hypothetical protein